MTWSNLYKARSLAWLAASVWVASPSTAQAPEYGHGTSGPFHSLGGAQCENTAMGVSSVPIEKASPLLELSQRPPRLRVSFMRILQGECAGSVVNAMHDLVVVKGGNTYRLGRQTGSVREARMIAAPEASKAFFPEGLDLGEVPTVLDSQFLGADDYMSVTTARGVEHRYIGLWSDGKMWTVRSFSVGAEPSKRQPPKLLLTARTPIRGIAFFPSVDTNSGQIWLVQQDSAGATVNLAIQWSHDSPRDD